MAERGAERVRRRRVYSERVERLMLEVYTTKPTIMFRDIATGRFVKAPQFIFLKTIMGAETGRGKEPFEVEVIASRRIDIDELVKLDPFKVGEYFDDVEKELYQRSGDVTREAFGPIIGAMLEERGRELTFEVLPRFTLRYRHPARYTEWKVLSLD